MMTRALVLLALLLGAGAVTAEGPGDDIAALIKAVHAHETRRVALSETVDQARSKEQTQALEIAARRDALSALVELLVIVETHGQSPGERHPGGPVSGARAKMLMTDMRPRLAERAATLAKSLTALAQARSDRQGAEAALDRAITAEQTAKADLTNAMAARTDMPMRFLSDPAQMAGLLAATETLAAFSDGLGAAPGPADTELTPQKGRLTLPVSGQVVASAATDLGLTLDVPAGALVTAPMAATIRYAGPLLDLGQVIVLEPEAGKHLILAQMGTTYGVAGEIVAGGAPLGLTRRAKPNDAHGTERAEVSGTPGRETLYIGLRINQTPVDPADWFAETKDG